MIEFTIKTNPKSEVTAELVRGGEVIEEFSADGLKMFGLLIEDTTQRIKKVQDALK